MKQTAENPQRKEAEITPEVLQALQASGAQIFRNTRGRAKYGQTWVAYGVGPNGAGDFIGFLPVRITKEMVGKYVAVFISAETKRPFGADYSKDQVLWRDRVRAAGGIAGFCHRWEDGRALVMDWLDQFRKKK